MNFNEIERSLEKFSKYAEEVQEFSEKINQYLEKARQEMEKIEKFIQNCKDENKKNEMKKDILRAFMDIKYKFDNLSSVRYKLDDLEEVFLAFQNKIKKVENKI